MTEHNGLVNYIDFDIMRKMCHPIAMALFDSHIDPMTLFDDHDRALLESALSNPRQTFNSQELYPEFNDKAAILYYSLIKNHAFDNGNKRTATATLLVFLSINNRLIIGEQKEVEDYLVNLAKRVASSKGSEDKDDFLNEIKKWLEQNTAIEDK